MRRFALQIVVIMCLSWVGDTRSDTNYVITSYNVNGELTFNQHAFGTNYSVEWSPTASGPWTNTWKQLRNITPTGSTHTVCVPMMYRVTAELPPYDIMIKKSFDDQGSVYISTNDNEAGLLIGTQTHDIYTPEIFMTNLTSGVTNYLHIQASDSGIIAGILAEVLINNMQFCFVDSSRHLLTQSNVWRLSRTGFGSNYEPPSVINLNQEKYYQAMVNWHEVPGISSNAAWIWSGNQYDLNVTRYFSLEVIPVQSNR